MHHVHPLGTPLTKQHAIVNIQLHNL